MREPQSIRLLLMGTTLTEGVVYNFQRAGVLLANQVDMLSEAVQVQCEL